jgi:hypothetical protein
LDDRSRLSSPPAPTFDLDDRGPGRRTEPRPPAVPETPSLRPIGGDGRGAIGSEHLGPQPERGGTAGGNGTTDEERRQDLDGLDPTRALLVRGPQRQSYDENDHES